MEVLIFLVMIVLLVVILSTNSGTSDKILTLNKKLDLTLRKLDQVANELEKWKASSTQQAPHPPQDSFLQNFPLTQDQSVPNPLPAVSPFVEERIAPDFIFPEETRQPETQEEEEHVLLPAKEQEPVLEEVPIAAFTSPKVPPKPSFFERNPDLEKFIGENLINKIGIAILVLGIGFFVKYAIDQNWINEIGRVAIGILCGGVLLGIAHYLRHTFKPFSSVLVGGGLAIFYFTIAIAFQEYQLFSKEAAFGIMVVVTGFAILLSIAYDRMELAVLAIVGGFTSPFFVSDGSGNYAVLFTYVLVLNIGMLVLAYFKRWNLVNIVSYAFTVLLFGGWLGTKVLYQPDPPYLGALLFATVFYVIFFLMNIINNVKENRKFVASEISILLSNNVFYYSAGMLILKNIQSGAYQGLFTIIVGVFNFVFAFVLYRSNKADKNLVYLLIGLVLTFASLAGPVQLEGNYITMFWALEGVLLLWLSQKTGIQLIKKGSILVLLLMIVSLVMDWEKIYFHYAQETLPFFLNKAFITSGVSLVSLLGILQLLKKESIEFLPSFETSWYKTAVSLVFVVLCYVAFLLEFYYQTEHLLTNDSTRALYLGSYNLAFACAVLFWLKSKSFKSAPIISLVITGLLAFSYLLDYNVSAAEVRNLALTHSTSSLHYYYHYFLVILMGTLVGLSSKSVFALHPIRSPKAIPYLWVFAAFLIYLASAELEHFLVYLFYQNEETTPIEGLQHNVFRIGFPILWGLCSFALMYLGMKYKIKTLRIISLSLFGFTLLKLFIFDVSQMNEGGKIAAFISLGVLLLIVSFMYQKLKKLIIEDDTK